MADLYVLHADIVATRALVDDGVNAVCRVGFTTVSFSVHRYCNGQKTRKSKQNYGGIIHPL